MPSNTQRKNRAHKIAYWTDVQRIYHTITLTAFMHWWAIKLLSVLIPSALTALQFLAALHRIGGQGYIGCAVAYSLLAPQIALATGRKCSVRTLQRGLKALTILGFVKLRRWTMPDQTIHLDHGRTVVVRGTAKKDIGGNEWRSLQINIIVLTSKATEMWDLATRYGSSKDHLIPHSPTHAKLAARSKLDQIDKSIMVESPNTDSVTSTDHSQVVFDNEPSNSKTQQITSHEQGRPTRPVSSKTPRQTLEHRASTVPELPASPDTPKQTLTKASKQASLSAKTQPKPSDIGCSAEIPKIPHKSKNKHTWDIGQIYILNELHKTLSKFTQREADTIYNRAVWELSRDYPPGWPTAVDWAYWVGRFADFLPAQRKIHIMRDMLPLLRNFDEAVTPREPKYYKSGKISSGAATTHQVGKALLPFLKGFADKFCGD